MLKNLKILVIDDDMKILNTITKLLNCEGYRVHLSSNTTEAHDISRKLVPDLILCNIGIAISGKEHARLDLQRISDEHHIPFIFYIPPLIQNQKTELTGLDWLFKMKMPLISEIVNVN